MRAKIYWISQTKNGRLGIMARPRAGDWLADEIKSWQQQGVTIVVSLLTQPEVNELDLGTEAATCTAAKIKFLSFPIEDRQVPQSIIQTMKFVQQLEKFLEDGHTVAIHCRMGVGRSALIAAAVLQQSGMSVGQAFQNIQAARGVNVPDTDAQRKWVERFADFSDSYL